MDARFAFFVAYQEIKDRYNRLRKEYVRLRKSVNKRCICMDQTCVSGELSNIRSHRSDSSMSETSLAPYLSCASSSSTIGDAAENVAADVEVLLMCKRLERLAAGANADVSDSLVSVANQLRNVACRMSPMTDDRGRLSDDESAGGRAVGCSKNDGGESENWTDDRIRRRGSGNTRGNHVLAAERVRPVATSGGVSLLTGPKDGDSGIDADTRDLELVDNLSRFDAAADASQPVDIDRSGDFEFSHREAIIQSGKLALALQQQLSDVHRELSRQRDILKNWAERTTETETFIAEGDENGESFRSWTMLPASQ